MQNRFLRQRPWRPSWISHICHLQDPDASYKVSHQLAIHFRRRSGHLGFPIQTILAIFELQVSPMLPTKFQVNWPFSSGGEANKSLRWRPWRPSWISVRNDFTYFLIYKSPRCFLQFQVDWTFSLGEEMTNRFSRCGHLEFSIITILAIFYLHVTPLLPT